MNRSHGRGTTGYKPGEKVAVKLNLNCAERKVDPTDGPYNTPHEAAFDEQVRANNFVIELDHPTVGRYATSGMPIQMEKSRAEIRGPSPQLGEHTREVMAELGLDDSTIDALHAAGVIKSLDD